MSDLDNSTVIHRKARRGRADFDARAMSPSRALRLAFEMSADRLFGLALSVRAVEQRRLAAAALGDEADDGGLIVLLDGPGGARGAALFDPPLVQALIEVQTTGRVRPGPPPARAFTGTDAAMTAPLIDAAMRRFADLMAGAEAGAEGDGGPPTGPEGQPGRFRFGDRVADARALALAVGDGDLDLFRLTVDIGGGVHTGTLAVVLPPGAGLPPDPGGTAEAGGSFDLAAVALGVPVVLDAVLARIRLPLADICALKPGTILPVGAAAIGQAELVAAGGHVAARARLGQMHGFRALRLAGPALAAGQGMPEHAAEPGTPALPPVPAGDAPRAPASGTGRAAPPRPADRPQPQPPDLTGQPEMEES